MLKSELPLKCFEVEGQR